MTYPNGPTNPAGQGARLYRLHLTAIGSPIWVAADHDQDALDEAADYAESRGWDGFFLTEEEAQEREDDGADVERAGSHGRPLSEDPTIIDLGPYTPARRLEAARSAYVAAARELYTLDANLHHVTREREAAQEEHARTKAELAAARAANPDTDRTTLNASHVNASARSYYLTAAAEERNLARRLPQAVQAYIDAAHILAEAYEDTQDWQDQLGAVHLQRLHDAIDAGIAYPVPHDDPARQALEAEYPGPTRRRYTADLAHA